GARLPAGTGQPAAANRPFLRSRSSRNIDLSFVMMPVIDHHEACLPTAAASDESSLRTSTAQKPLHR
ncbi:hypothetical protein, partial [Pseudomonas avellanae]|uniref:hypothetical protein n=2 Tax=Pseudomonas TaxID=286 RepID=UPI001C8066BA